jgi:hypothetical protein
MRRSEGAIMILETLRVVTDALAHESYGVNATLASLPLDGDDVRPEAPATIKDSTRDAIVARNRVNDELPSLTVLLDDGTVDMDGEVQTSYRDADINVVIQYLGKNIDSDGGLADGFYMLRAVERTIRTLMLNENANDRTRNGIQLLQVNSIRHAPGFASANDALAAGELSVSFRVRDTAP